MNHSVIKNYWFWITAVLIVGFFFFYLNFDLPRPGFWNTARLTIKFDDSKVRVFEGEVVEDMTVLQALLSASLGGDFDFGYSLDENGSVNLASINSAANGQKTWHFYLNGESVETGEIARIKIKAGDSIEARYE